MKEKFVISIVSNFSREVISLVSTYLLFLFLDVELLGIWALLNSVINLGFLFADLGLERIHYQYSGKKNFANYFGTFFTLRFLLLIFNFFFTLGLIFLLDLWKSEYIEVIIFLLISQIIMNILNIFIIEIKAKVKVFKIEIPLFLVTIGQSLFKIYIALNLDVIQNPLFWLSFVMLIFNLIYTFLILIFSKKEILFKKPNFSYFSEYLKDTKPLIIFSILSVISANIGNLILYYSLSSKELGYFYLINGYIIPILSIFSTSVISICTPLFSQYYEKNDKELIEKTIHLIEKYTSVLYLIIILIVYSSGILIFSLILPQYLPAVPILYILIIDFYLKGIGRGYEVVLIAGKKQKLLASLSSFDLILQLFLFSILIPILGFIGYGLALLIPTTIGVFYKRYFPKKIFDIKPQKQIIFHIIIGFILLLIILTFKFFIIDFLIENLIIQLIILILSSVGLTLISFFTFKLLRKEDVNFFLELLKVKNYKRSLNEEFLDL